MRIARMARRAPPFMHANKEPSGGVEVGGVDVVRYRSAIQGAPKNAITVIATDRSLESRLRTEAIIV
jgi:hypothetical protein